MLKIYHKGLYAASKRSLEILSEIMRLELEPVGVNVLSVVIQSKGQTYFEDWNFPADSIYKPIENTIAQRAREIDGVTREDTNTYAVNVVDDIIRGTTGKVWRGGGARGTSFAATFIPQGMMVMFRS